MCSNIYGEAVFPFYLIKAANLYCVVSHSLILWWKVYQRLFGRWIGTNCKVYIYLHLTQVVHGKQTGLMWPAEYAVPRSSEGTCTAVVINQKGHNDNIWPEKLMIANIHCIHSWAHTHTSALKKCTEAHSILDAATLHWWNCKHTHTHIELSPCTCRSKCTHTHMRWRLIL